MSHANTPPVLGADMRAVRRELAGASDESVLKVLRYVDALPDRGQADGLLAPLRDRLRALRPHRPLRFSRLLATPLEPVLVDPRVWRPGLPTVPRTTITPFAELVRGALPFIAAEVDRIGASSAGGEVDTVCAAGRILWADAAAVLRAGAAPPGWAETGLPASAAAGLGRSCAMVLANAWRVQLLHDPTVPLTEVNDVLANLLREAEAESPVAWGMVLAVLLQQFPQAHFLLTTAAAKRGNRDMRACADTALELAWRWLESAAEGSDDDDAQTAARALRRQINLLDTLALDGTNRRRAMELRRSLGRTCTDRFVADVNASLIAKLPRDLPSAPTTIALNDAEIVQLEANARALRCLDAECRRLGTGSELDAKLHDAASVIGTCDGLPAIDRLRLVEILLGAQAALRLSA